jgi:hypothetical protein
LRAILLALALAVADPSSKVCTYIQTIAPQVRQDRAKKLAKLIYRTARASELDPITLAAIVRQESNFRPDCSSCYIIYKNRSCYSTCDLGLAQINLVWVNKWGLNGCRLVHDDAYNLQVAARILKALKNRYGLEEPLTWFSRYNSATERYRDKYQGRLNVFLVQRGQ